MSVQDILPYFQIIACVSVPVGWYFAHNFAKSRQTHADLAKFARETVADVEAIEQMALNYHIADTRNKDDEDTILRKLDKLELRIESINKHIEKDKKKNEIEAWPFKKSITISNFMTASFERQDKHSEIIQNITGSAKQLIQKLYLF